MMFGESVSRNQWTVRGHLHSWLCSSSLSCISADLHFGERGTVENLSRQAASSWSPLPTHANSMEAWLFLLDRGTAADLGLLS